MTIINDNLVKALDGNAPQYKKEGEDVFEPLEGKDGAGNFRMVDSDVDIDVIPFYFNSSSEVVFTETSLVRSSYIDVSKYKEIEIFVLNQVKGSEVYVNISSRLRGESAYLLAYYDWEEEKWVRHNVGGDDWVEGGVDVMFANSTHQMLSTHPRMYWLKNYIGDEIRLNVRAMSNPTGSGNTFRAWLVGVKNV